MKITQTTVLSIKRSEWVLIVCLSFFAEYRLLRHSFCPRCTMNSVLTYLDPDAMGTAYCLLEDLTSICCRLITTISKDYRLLGLKPNAKNCSINFSNWRVYFWLGQMCMTTPPETLPISVWRTNARLVITDTTVVLPLKAPWMQAICVL